MPATRPIASDWVEEDTQTNATATATHAAESNQSHHITSVSGSFAAAAAGKTLILSAGSTEVARWHVHNSFHMEFPSPIRLASGQAASLALAAGGSGVSGTAVLTGFTLP